MMNVEETNSHVKTDENTTLTTTVGKARTTIGTTAETIDETIGMTDTKRKNPDTTPNWCARYVDTLDTLPELVDKGPREHLHTATSHTTDKPHRKTHNSDESLETPENLTPQMK